MGKQMVKKEEQSLVKLDLKKYAGRGSENATSTEDLAIPIVQLLQGQSQKVKDGKGDAGQFSNNVTNQIVDSFDAIPCAYWRDYIGWVPRSKGGGFGCRYTVEQIEGGEVKTKWIEYTGEDGKLRRKLMDEQGHEVRDTRNHLVLMRVEGEGWMPALIPMASTQVKKSKRWNTRMKSIELPDGQGGVFNPPTFAYQYHITSEDESGGGNDWKGFDISMTGPVEDEALIQKANSWFELFKKGELQFADDKMEGEGSSVEGEAF